MLCKKSLNITSLGYGQQTVKMQVYLVKTGFSPLLDPLWERQEAQLFQNTNLHILHTTQNQFFLAEGGWGRIQQYVLNSLFPLVVNGGKAEDPNKFYLCYFI